MQSFKEHFQPLEEGLNVTNGDITKMFKPLKKEIARLRKSEADVDQRDADTLEHSLKPALNARNVKQIAKAMNGGETETREIMFKIVSSVIGKEQAQLLSRQ